WLSNTAYASTLLFVTVAILHLDLYTAGHEVLVALGGYVVLQDQEMLHTLEEWPTIYSAALIMVNQCSSYYRNHSSHAQWLDLLATVGRYGLLDMEWPSLGVTVEYMPGTLVAFSDKLVQHGVGHAEDHRVSITFYMKKNVHDAVEVGKAGWAIHSLLLD
ncbi:hypothetical protein F5I97DRAFT_1800421, partial [Phlebopus sp. FC_14]